MVLGFHENEALFALIAPFLYSDDLSLAAAINQRTWQQQHSNTADIKKDFERWRDWVTDLHYEEWCKFENNLALLGFQPSESVGFEYYLSDHFPGDSHLRDFLSSNSP